MVAAVSASAGERPICMQASESMNGIDGTGDEPGLKSVASTMARPSSTILRAGRILRAAQREDRSGQKNRLHAGIAQLEQRFFGRGLEVIGGRGAQFRGQGRARAGTKLLGVDANAEAVLLCRR